MFKKVPLLALLTLPAFISSSSTYAAEALIEYCENCSDSQMDSIITAKFTYNKNCPYAKKDECFDAEFKEYKLFIANSEHSAVTKYDIKHGKYFLNYSKSKLTNDEKDFFYELRELKKRLLKDSESGGNLLPHSGPMKGNSNQ